MFIVWVKFEDDSVQTFGPFKTYKDAEVWCIVRESPYVTQNIFELKPIK